LIEKFLKDLIDVDVYNEKLREYKKEIASIEKELNNTHSEDIDIHEQVKKLCELVKTAHTKYREGNEEEKLEVLKSLQCELIAKGNKELVLEENRLIKVARLLIAMLQLIYASKSAD
jgi:hypothetical protein